MVTFADIQQAAARLEGHIMRTPVMTSRQVDALVGAHVHLKAEVFQRTGSFKARGALNKMLSLTEEERAKGVVTMSSGNHAQAVAWAAAHTGTTAVVVMPRSAPRPKVEATRGYGATVQFEADHNAIFGAADRIAAEEGRILVHPFDDPVVIAGQGTLGAEFIEDAPPLDAIVVPIGGGGLIAGVTLSVRALAPSARIIGVEPEGAAAMSRSLVEEMPVRLERVDTIADGLSPPMAGQIAFPIVQKHVERIVTVPDPLIRKAVRFFMERTKLVVEPAGAAGLAGLMSQGLDLEPDDTVGVVVSGGNLDCDRWAELVHDETVAP